MGIEAAADPFDGDQRSDQQDQRRRDVQVVGADEADQLAEQRTQLDSLEGELGIRSNQLAQVAVEPPGIQRLSPDIERLECAEDAVGILREQADEEVGDPLPGLAVESSEHPVIERGNDSAGQHAEIPRVGIGMEEAQLEDLLEQDSRTRHGDAAGFGPEGADPLQVVDGARPR